MSNPAWLLESWVEYAICMGIILLRVVARTQRVGYRRWQGDDYLILLVVVMFTVQMTKLQGINDHGMNIGLTAERAAKLSVEQLETISQGSLENLVLWLSYTTVLWSLKGCMLFFYRRLTIGLWQRKLVAVASYLLVLTYIACICTILFHCGVPVSKQWALYPPESCVANITKILMNFYVVGITNFTTDALLLCIPTPLLWRAKIPMKRKIVIGLMLCGGVFVMMATSLRTILSVISLYDDDTGRWEMILGWIVREPFVAVIVVNAPCIKPLIWPTKNPRRHSSLSLSFSTSNCHTPARRPSESKPRSASATQFLCINTANTANFSFRSPSPTPNLNEKRRSSMCSPLTLPCGKAKHYDEEVAIPRPVFVYTTHSNSHLNTARAPSKAYVYEYPRLQPMVSSDTEYKFDSSDSIKESSDDERTRSGGGSSSCRGLAPTPLSPLSQADRRKMSVDIYGRHDGVNVFSRDEDDDWCSTVMEERRAEVTGHGRSKSEGSNGLLSVGGGHHSVMGGGALDKDEIWRRRSMTGKGPVMPIAVLKL